MLHTDESIYFSPHCKILQYIIAIRLKIKTYFKHNIVHKLKKNTLASSLYVAGYGHFVHITGNFLPHKTAREESSRILTSNLNNIGSEILNLPLPYGREKGKERRVLSENNGPFLVAIV